MSGAILILLIIIICKFVARSHKFSLSYSPQDPDVGQSLMHFTETLGVEHGFGETFACAYAGKANTRQSTQHAQDSGQ